MNTETLTLDAFRAIDHLAAHLVAVSVTNEQAADIAAGSIEAKDALKGMMPDELADTILAGSGYPIVKPNVGPNDLPGTEEEQERRKRDEDDDEQPVTPETETEPDAVYAVPV